MESIATLDAKERIRSVSIRLFSQKGYDATRVSEIAQAAGVNKALIYYYFKNKEEILDDLIGSLFDHAASIVMDYIHSGILSMIESGALDIEPDRFHFIDRDALQSFLDQMDAYQEQLLDFILKNRALIRVLMLESLKNGKHHNDLFRLLDFFRQSQDNPIYSTIWNADKDFTYSDSAVFFKFFYIMTPMFDFAAYYDDYKLIRGKSDREVCDAFLSCNRIIRSSMITGTDILVV